MNPHRFKPVGVSDVCAICNERSYSEIHTKRVTVPEVDASTSVDAIKDALLDDEILAWHLRMATQGGRLTLYRHWVGGNNPKGLLYTDCYSKTHAYVRYLVTLAKKANPAITDDEIEHNIINNSSHKGMMTCEFPCPKKPRGWLKINSLPTTF